MEEEKEDDEEEEGGEDKEGKEEDEDAPLPPPPQEDAAEKKRREQLQTKRQIRLRKMLEVDGDSGLTGWPVTGVRIDNLQTNGLKNVGFAQNATWLCIGLIFDVSTWLFLGQPRGSQRSQTTWLIEKSRKRKACQVPDVCPPWKIEEKTVIDLASSDDSDSEDEEENKTIDQFAEEVRRKRLRTQAPVRPVLKGSGSTENTTKEEEIKHVLPDELEKHLHHAQTHKSSSEAQSRRFKKKTCEPCFEHDDEDNGHETMVCLFATKEIMTKEKAMDLGRVFDDRWQTESADANSEQFVLITLDINLCAHCIMKFK
eukprot:jgi/Bigna1/78354/fgenesh1_pg.54_\